MENDLEYDRVDHRAIRLAYRFLLGRDAESNERIETYFNARNLDEVREVFLKSPEFLNQSYFRERLADSIRFCEKYKAAEVCLTSSCKKSNLCILQTSDTKKYPPLLMESSRASIAYANRWNIQYQMYIGLKVGTQPHHAMFNRIFLLRDLINSGYRGWVLYLDADTVICDHQFDVYAYLSNKLDFAFIFARADLAEDCPYWNINTGIFFANLNHDICRFIINKWAEFYEKRYCELDFIHALNWDDILNDQTSLHGLLRMPCFENYIDSTVSNLRIFNSGSSTFIRQFIRGDHTHVDDYSFTRRLMDLRAAVQAALASSNYL